MDPATEIERAIENIKQRCKDIEEQREADIQPLMTAIKRIEDQFDRGDGLPLLPGWISHLVLAFERTDVRHLDETVIKELSELAKSFQTRPHFGPAPTRFELREYILDPLRKHLTDSGGINDVKASAYRVLQQLQLEPKRSGNSKKEDLSEDILKLSYNLADHVQKSRYSKSLEVFADRVYDMCIAHYDYEIKNYNLFKNNCQHYATFCALGWRADFERRPQISSRHIILGIIQLVASVLLEVFFFHFDRFSIILLVCISVVYIVIALFFYLLRKISSSLALQIFSFMFYIVAILVLAVLTVVLGCMLTVHASHFFVYALLLWGPIGLTLNLYMCADSVNSIAMVLVIYMILFVAGNFHVIWNWIKQHWLESLFNSF